MPTPSRLESTCQRLLDEGDLQTVVAMVEKWSESADPTVAARLVQAEAFLRLRLMDKAWVRLKSLVDAEQGGIKPYVLSARLFLDRGWPGKARKVIQKGLDRDPDEASLQDLWEEATGEPAAVDTSRADAPDVSHDELVTLAEHFMTQGAFVRAKSLLERVRRSEPNHGRANDLLWGLAGEFTLEESLADVVDRYAPDLSALAELSDDGDHTESADIDNLPLQIDRDNGADHFPALFRHLEPTDADQAENEGEVTAVSSLAEMQKLAEQAEEAIQEGIETGEDTQIMRVVHKAGTLEPVGDESAHRNAPEVDSAFNLADFRREMGMEPQRLAGDVDYQVPEDEDDSVVVVTRREEVAREEEQRGAGLTLDTSAEAKAAAKQGDYREERWANLADNEPTQPPASAASVADTVTEAAPKPAPRPAPPPAQGPVFSWPWWLAVLALIMAFGVVLFGLLTLLLML